MPKPIPPPPPLPTVEETQSALKFLFWVVLCGCVFFFVISQSYHKDASVLNYGRSTSIAWNVWKADNLIEEKYRPQPDMKVVWLVGSSILREGFDEEWINAQLEKTASKYRVAKFGINRGAAGVSFGMLRKLPIKEGDVVLHGVSAANFRKDWLKAVEIPAYQLMDVYTAEDFWEIEEWSLAQKLEQAAAIPYSFWRHHESYTLGLTRIWNATTQQKKAKRSKSKHHTKYHTFLKKKSKKILLGTDNFDHFPSDENDFSGKQINIWGLEKMKSLVKERGATLSLVHIGESKEYIEGVLNPPLQLQWKEWKRENAVWATPSLPLTQYYDLKHPNRIGRQKLSRMLLQWLENERF